jgi:hypothetical protein
MPLRTAGQPADSETRVHPARTTPISWRFVSAEHRSADQTGMSAVRPVDPRELAVVLLNPAVSRPI